MVFKFIRAHLAVALLMLVPNYSAGAVFSDVNAAVEIDELDYVLKNTPVTRLSALLNSKEERFVFIAGILQGIKVSQKVDEIARQSADADTNDYWARVYAIRAAERKFLEERFQSELTVPPLEEIAQEQFFVNIDEIAPVPEKREASHILIRCEDPCDSERVDFKWQQITERFEKGESFGRVAALLSDDYGSAKADGKLSTSIAMDDTRVSLAFREALFALDAVGDVSQRVQSEFGVHLIRLEAIEPARERGFDEVAEAMKASAEQRYRKDALREFFKEFGPTESLKIDEQQFETLLKAELERRK